MVALLALQMLKSDQSSLWKKKRVLFLFFLILLVFERQVET